MSAPIGLIGGSARRASSARALSQAAAATRYTPGPAIDEFERAFDLSRNPAQARFVGSPAKFAMYVGGLGAGKTFAGALRAAIAALTLPGSLGVIGAPTYRMLEDATMKEFWKLLPAGAVAHYNGSARHLWLRNGSEILFRSMSDPDVLRGVQLAWFWLDEAPYCGYYAWTVAKGRLRQPGYGGWGWATGTPRGKDGYYADFERRRQRGHHLERASTMANAANLPDGYVESMNYTGEFYRQEVLGQFTAYEGLVYYLEDEHTRTPAPGVAFPRTIGGIDWGYRNPAALLPVALDHDDRAWVLDEWYQTRRKTEEIVAEAVRLTRRYGVEHWYCGTDEPGSIALLNERLQEAHLACRASPAVTDVVEGIQTVQGFLSARPDGSRGLYVTPRARQLLSEFGQYAYKEKLRALRNGDEKPEKQFDHALDALRYALHSAYGAHARRADAARRHVARRVELRREREAALAPKPGPVAPDDDWY